MPAYKNIAILGVSAAFPSSGSTRTSARCCASALADDRFSFALRSQASGNVGKPILKALLDAGQFEVTVLSRKASNATFPTGAKVVKTDFSADSLADLFRGQDAVVSAIPSQVGKEQIKFIDAALEAGVKRFITSDVRHQPRSEEPLVDYQLTFLLYAFMFSLGVMSRIPQWSLPCPS
jgi:hypothetical protein